jgi:hypothetical protein
VPYAKDRLGIDERVLGILLLCLGVGSLLAMFFAGTLSSRFGTRPVILVSGFALAAVLPWLAIASTPFTLGVTLLLFGATLGSLDVAMNIHGVEVEHAVGQPLLSGFHALYSLGGFAGAAFITLLLSLGLGPLLCVVIGAGLMVMAMFATWPGLLRTRTAEGEPHFALPRGVVLVIARARRDHLPGRRVAARLECIAHHWQWPGGRGAGWHGLHVVLDRDDSHALHRRRTHRRIGDRAIMIGGSLVAIAGFIMLLIAPVVSIAMAAFILIGLGAANVVPVLFRRAGSQKVMPPGLAIAVHHDDRLCRHSSRACCHRVRGRSHRTDAGILDDPGVVDIGASVRGRRGAA